MRVAVEGCDGRDLGRLVPRFGEADPDEAKNIPPNSLPDPKPISALGSKTHGIRTVSTLSTTPMTAWAIAHFQVGNTTSCLRMLKAPRTQAQRIT